jgi:protein involved in polysaccharide export with SLBB domain
MRIVILLLFGLFANLLQAQSLPAGMSPNQAMNVAKTATKDQLLIYVLQAKAQGYTLNEVKSLLRAQGATASDLAKLDELWNDDNSEALNADPSETAAESMQSNFGLLGRLEDQQEDPYKVALDSLFTVRRFGSDFFTYVEPKEVPELYLATPLDYQLGPGDELLVELYGGSEQTYDVQISREGTIKVDRLAPVFLSGLTFREAKRLLEAKFSAIYTGLQATESNPAKVYLSVSLRKARSVVVNITGQVKVPGTYTLSSFTSIINALYAAGGPNAVGSYRSVRLLRSGKVIEEIDLYDFFVNGKTPITYLKDQDVIQVPSLYGQVELAGAFKNQGFYEIKKGETLADVLSFSGGLLSDAYKDKVFVNRINKFKRELLTFDTSKDIDTALLDGDVITAELVRVQLENFVSVEGEVYVPGQYGLGFVKTVGDLIAAANGITLSALQTRAILFRSFNGVERIVLPIDLTSEASLLTPLTNEDRLFIPSQKSLTGFSFVQIEGEVNNPGMFTYSEGMTLSDALIQAKGFTALANGAEVTVYNTPLKVGDITVSKTISVSSNLEVSEEVLLSPFDLIVVRQLSGYKPIEKVTLQGFIKNQGIYALKGGDYRLHDLLIEAGGFLEEAYLPGISITRKVLSDDNNSEAIKVSVAGTEDKETVDQLKSEVIVIGIDGEKLVSSKGADFQNNLVLQQGDVITVPKIDNTVTVIGKVQQKSKISYRSGVSIKKALRRAGGFSEDARKSKVYVVYQNGSIKSRRSFLGLVSFDPKLKPGATVIVPEKLPSSSRTSLGEIVGLSSSLATLVLLIQQLGI